MQHGVWASGGFYDASMTLTRLLGPLAVIVLVLAAPGAHAQGAAGARPVPAAKPAQGTATAPDAATAPKAPSAAETFPADSIRVTLPKESAKLLEGGPHGGRMIVFRGGAQAMRETKTICFLAQREIQGRPASGAADPPSRICA